VTSGAWAVTTRTAPLLDGVASARWLNRAVSPRSKATTTTTPWALSPALAPA
jgi:hypothetical protein